MWDSVYTTPGLSDIAMGLIRHKVLDITRQNGKVVQCISLPKPMAFPVCEENLDKMKEKLVALEMWQDSEDLRWAREKEAKVGAGVWMWWTDGSRSDDGRVGAAAVCKHGNQWRSRRSYLGTGRMEVFDAELWAIGHALEVTIEKRETLQKHGVKTVAVFSDSQAAIRRTAHLEPGPGQRLARRINRRAQALLAHGIATEIHWVPGHSGIPGNEEADRQVNLARGGSGNTTIERP
jgi:ribonuclease HI